MLFVKHLKAKIHPEDEHKTNSPWNIAADFDIDMMRTFFETDLVTLTYGKEKFDAYPLEYEDVETGSLTSFDIRFGRRFSYKKAGYKINIPYSKFYNNPDFTGENRIMVSFTQQGINHNFFAGSAKVNVRDASDMQARIYENTYFRCKYALKNEIMIEIFP